MGHMLFLALFYRSTHPILTHLYAQHTLTHSIGIVLDYLNLYRSKIVWVTCYFLLYFIGVPTPSSLAYMPSTHSLIHSSITHLPTHTRLFIHPLLLISQPTHSSTHTHTLIQPLISEEEMEHTRKVVAAFGRPGGEGEMLHEQLLERARTRDSWVS